MPLQGALHAWRQSCHRGAACGAAVMPQGGLPHKCREAPSSCHDTYMPRRSSFRGALSGRLSSAGTLGDTGATSQAGGSPATAAALAGSGEGTSVGADAAGVASGTAAAPAANGLRHAKLCGGKLTLRGASAWGCAAAAAAVAMV